MPRPCEAEGHYRAKITEYGLAEMDSGAVCVKLQAHLLQRWNDEGEWEDISKSEIYCRGDIWVLTKSSKVNEPAVQSLVNHAGWDASLESILEQTWQPINCRVDVKKETYKDVDRYKIAFLNAWDKEPGGIGNVSRKRLGELQDLYGEELRKFRAAPGTQPAYQETEYQHLSQDPDDQIPF